MFGSFFLGTIMTGLAKFEVGGEIMPGLSKSISSCCSHIQCQRGSMYGFWSRGLKLCLG